MSSTNAVQRELIYEVTAWDFLQRVQDLIIQGYRIDDSNENFPMLSVGTYTCGMLKTPSAQEIEVKLTAITKAPEVNEVLKTEAKPAPQKRGNKK